MPSKIKKSPISPRQKMINLMYVVLMAMLALNVSKDVLKGFSMIGESLHRTTQNAEQESTAIYDIIASQYKDNPTKVEQWYLRATEVRSMSDSLYDFAEQLKLEIARESDGEAANPNQLVNQEDLEAANTVMLSAVGGKGQQLFDAVNHYRERMLSYVSDPRQRQIISSDLSTSVPKDANQLLHKNWQQYMFEDMPSIVAITMLTKLQNDVRTAEAQILHSLRANIDVKDIRVNQLNAYVLPQSTTLMPGETFQSTIFMAAVDTTQRPEIYVNGKRIDSNGEYTFKVGSPGDYSFSGYVLMPRPNGESLRREFTQHYSVIAPPMGATVAADLMNVLYAGFDNPISVGASGIPTNKIQLSMSGGTLTRKGKGKYVARPSKVGQDVTFTVLGEVKGIRKTMGRYTFKVRRLPDPTAYLTIGNQRFKGGKLSKSDILNAGRLYAAIDDGLLDIQFKVKQFETLFLGRMGEALKEKSSGSQFTPAQLRQIRQLRRGQMFYIRGVEVSGPDGTTRTLPQALEVIVN